MTDSGIESLSHLVVEVTDLDAAEAFYRDGIGLAPVGRDLWPDCGAHAVFAAGDQHLVLARNPDKADLRETGVHHAYRASTAAREAARARLAAAGVAVETYREDRPAEAADNFYVFDPSGNRVQLVANGDGGSDRVSGIDHACVQDIDLEWSEAFYADILALPIDHVTGLRTEDYVRARDWGEEGIALAPGCCRRVRYYKEVPGQNRMQPRPNLQLYLRAGRDVIGVYMAIDDYAEPPEEQLAGTPRLAFRVRRGALDGVARRLEAAGRAFRGPVAHGPGAPIARSIYAKDTGGNFIEFCEG